MTRRPMCPSELCDCPRCTARWDDDSVYQQAAYNEATGAFIHLDISTLHVTTTNAETSELLRHMTFTFPTFPEALQVFQHLADHTPPPPELRHKRIREFLRILNGDIDLRGDQ